MAVNYNSWTVAKLEKEKDKIEKAIRSKEGKERKKALSEMMAVARKNGFDVKDLIGDLGNGAPGGTKKARGKKAGSGRSTGKVAPKYRNPEDPDVTWSGRGRKPKWIEAELEKNGSLDGVAI